MNLALGLVENGYMPTPLTRLGIRHLLRQRLADESAAYSNPDHAVGMKKWTDHMRASDIALVPDKANEQHYEVPPDLFLLSLGEHLKYSCCYYTNANLSKCNLCFSLEGSCVAQPETRHDFIQYDMRRSMQAFAHLHRNGSCVTQPQSRDDNPIDIVIPASHCLTPLLI